jgi:hypothetical protein
MFKVPIFITTFNRVECLEELVSWLEKAGQDEIYLLDNGSTYPPIVAYLKEISHTVIHTHKNMGNKAPWIGGYVQKYAADRYFVVTDPDIIPTDECPLDVFDYFKHSLEKHTDAFKMAFSLVLDDLPDHYEFKDQAIKLQGEWQREERRVADNFFNTRTDAILALHRPNSSQGKDAWRADKPYTARHMSWYDNSDNPSDELIYYRKKIHPRFANWGKEAFPPALQKRFEDKDWNGQW